MMFDTYTLLWNNNVFQCRVMIFFLWLVPGSDVAPSFLSQSNLFLSGRFTLDYKHFNTFEN